MIQSIFNSTISSNTLAVESVKNKLKNATSEKNLKAELLKQLPSEETIRQQLATLPQSKEALDIITKKYKALKNKCKNIENKLDQKITQIEGIQQEISSVTDRFNKLTEFIDIAREFIPTLKIVITVGRAGLNALPLTTPVGAPIPGAGGGAIVNLDDALKKAQSKINEFDAIIKVLDEVKNYILSQVTPINNNCIKGLQVLNTIKPQIQTQCLIADTIFLQIISEFSNLIDSDTSSETTVIQFENPEEILDNLENSNKEKFFEIIRSKSKPDKTFETGYKIIKK
jgi:hypothetical protein